MIKDKNTKRLVLLDAHAIIHRAYHALPDFATSKGEPTGALFGFVSMILKIASDLNPDFLAACFDLPKPTYRHQVYDAYKAGRAKTDDELISQIEKSKIICEALNIPIYSQEGFEADDILGTIVEKLAKTNLEIIIASGDMDTLQLVDKDRVKVYTIKKGINDTILYDEKKVLERFGFPPRLLPDFKGLRGDPSDNIIGIEGIGEKTATELIKQFGSIENLYESIKTKKTSLKIKPRILKLLEEGEEEASFSKLLATIRRDAPIDFVLPKRNWAEGLDLMKAKKLFKELEFRNLGARLEEVLKKSGVQIKPDSEVRSTTPIDPIELAETRLALSVVDSNLIEPTLEEILFFAKTEDFKEARKLIFEELSKRESLFVFENIEKPLIPILQKMQQFGIKIDAKYLDYLADLYKKELAVVEQKIWQEAGIKFNVASPKQLGEVIFERMGLTVKNQKKTSLGAKSTKESELQKMKDLHPIIPNILEYRELKKLLSSYLEPIPKMLDQNSRLHPRFIQIGATTGRMSSENPNIQNIPTGSERGKLIRKAFVSSKGSSLVAIDYSQIELRIAAFLSKDQRLINIFKEGKDVHRAVAAEVFRVGEEYVTKEMRRQAKVINFGILYGMGVTALQVNLGTDRKTAQEFLNTYFENFKGLALYLDKVKAEAESNGYTKTFFGRRRYFEGIKSKIPFIKAAAERMAINAPIQGTNADIIKIAMKKIDYFLEENQLEENVHLLMQIHDELVYEVADSVLVKFAKEAKQIMENIIPPEKIEGVPIVANVSVGKNWGEMEPFI